MIKREKKNIIHSTTIIAVRKDGKLAMASDGQVSYGDTVMKQHARKIQRLCDGKVLVGFAGAAADSFALLDRLEEKIVKYSDNLRRAAVEFGKEWRTDRILRRLDALLIVANKDDLLLVTGSGEIVEPDDAVIGIGSGGPYALAAARALLKYSNLSAREIAIEALKIAASICIYTNDFITLEEL